MHLQICVLCFEIEILIRLKDYTPGMHEDVKRSSARVGADGVL